MLAKEAVRDIMEKKGIGPTTLARMIGKDKPQYIQDRLNPAKGENLSIDKMDEMIHAMGYRIVLIPDNARLPKGGYEITGSQRKAPTASAD